MGRRRNIRRRKNYNRKKHIIMIAVTVVVVAALSFGVTAMVRSNKGDKDTNKEVKKKTEQNKTIAIHTSNPEVDEKYISEDLCIDTPYGVIHFPQEFGDYTHIEVDEAKDSYEVSFFCKYEENQVPLFAVTFGKAGKDAEVIGQLVDTDEEKKDVSIRLSELSIDTEWEKANAELIYAMQEAVNYIMENFESSYEFRPEK